MFCTLIHNDYIQRLFPKRDSDRAIVDCDVVCVHWLVGTGEYKMSRLVRVASYGRFRKIGQLPAGQLWPVTAQMG